MGREPFVHLMDRDGQSLSGQLDEIPHLSDCLPLRTVHVPRDSNDEGFDAEVPDQILQAQDEVTTASIRDRREWPYGNSEFVTARESHQMAAVIQREKPSNPHRLIGAQAPMSVKEPGSEPPGILAREIRNGGLNVNSREE